MLQRGSCLQSGHCLFPIFIIILLFHTLSSSFMDRQQTAPITNTISVLCSHIGKLSKKSLQNLLTLTYIPKCSACQSPLSPNTKIMQAKIDAHLCLHCGYLCCTNPACINEHERQNHLFWTKVKVEEEAPSLVQQQSKTIRECQIFCKECGSIDEQLKIDAGRNEQKAESLKKLTRFTQFVRESIMKLLFDVLIVSFNEYQEIDTTSQHPVFGLRNLGNTCFLNSVLQTLFYTEPFAEIYKNFAQKPQNLISQDKRKRKQLNFYYDDIIEKEEAQNWHVVSDKKTKAKQKIKRKNLQNFVPEGMVKDQKFNQIVGNFMHDAHYFVSETKGEEMIILEPVEILKRLGQFDSKYLLGQQQDAQELLIFIIDILSQGQMHLASGKQPDLKEKYRKVQTLLGHQKLSPIQQVFGSYLASHIVCLACGKQSWAVDFTYHYPVPISQQKAAQKSIEGIKNEHIAGIKYYKQLFYPESSGSCKLLADLFKPERLTNRQNYYSCQKCSGLSAIKQFYILDPPQILLVSLKRFQHGRKFKITKIVPFEQFIDVACFTLREQEQQGQIQNKSHQYELRAIIAHKGETITSGHYICYIKIKPKQGNNAWYQFSDEKVKHVTSKHVYKQEAYILLYEKVKEK